MIDWYPWLVLAHVLGGFAFVLAHGVSAFVAFRIRRDRRPEHVASMLELSNTSMWWMYGSLLVLLAAGIAAGFVGEWWGRLWIWLALGLLLAIAVAMYLMATVYYTRVRQALGLGRPPTDGPPSAQISADELAALLDPRRPHLLALIGGVGLVLIVWLMVMKPW